MGRHCYTKTTYRLNKLLLGNLRTNREREILPSSQGAFAIDQSAFSNLALYVITGLIIV